MLILNVSQMSDSSSTITIDLENDDEEEEQQLVSWLKDLIISLEIDVYYQRAHHFNDLQE